MAGIDIGPIHIGDSTPPDPNAPKPQKIADIEAEAQANGGQVFKVIQAKNGQATIDPNYVLQPGDQVEFLDANSRHMLGTVDGTGVIPGVVPLAPDKTKTSPKLEMPTEGTPLERQTALRDAALNRYNDPETPDSEKSGLLALIHQAETAIHTMSQDELKAGGKDADTQALAAAALAKRQAGQTPTQQELAAYFKVHGGSAGGQGQYAMPIPGYAGPLNKHHAGNENGAVDLFAPPGTPVVAAAGGKVVRAGSFGAAGNDIFIQGDDGRVYDYEHVDGLQIKPGDTVKAGQPLAVVATLENGGSSVGDATHLHFAVGGTPTSIDYNNHGTGTDFDTLGFLKGVQSGNPAALSGILPPPKPEVHAIGNRLYQYDPATQKWTVAVDGSAFAAPTTHAIGNTLYQYDPNTQQWKQAIVGQSEIEAEQLQKGKIQTLLDQAQSTKTYIQQQLASGTLTPQQADTYMHSLNDYVAAGLQGTTPWERYQHEQQQQLERTKVAKDLLDTKLTQTTKMATDLLGNAIQGVQGTKYATVAPGTFSGIFQGALDAANQQAKPLSDLAQQLLATVGTKAAGAGLDPRVPIPGISGPGETEPMADTVPQPMAA